VRATLHHPHTTYFHVRASRRSDQLLTILVRCSRAAGSLLMRRSHRLEGMPQTSSFAGLAAGEEAARSAMACEHRGRGVGPSWACGALSKLLRVYLTPSAPPVGPAHSCMSGREVFEGNHERMGAHVIENAKLAQPPPPRAGPNRSVRVYLAYRLQ
jgi:hypothetical protein